MARHSKTAGAMLALAGAVLLAACGEKGGQAPGSDATSPAASGEKTAVATTGAEGPADAVVVYYFHGTRRCPTCLGIQKTIAEAVRDRFAEETAAGDVVFREIDYDLKENKHFAEEFQLSFSTMIVALVKGGKTAKWENCDKVWEHARDPLQLGNYAEERIRAYLKLLREG
jgi:hypothetical protein